jgi:hypothetical protein
LPRVLFVADGRSPIARNWIAYFAAAPEWEAHLVSTFPAAALAGLASYRSVSVAGSGAAAGRAARAGRAAAWVGLRTRLRHWLAPLTLGRAGGSIRAAATEIRPDLVHALRIPYEGMAAAAAGLDAPLLLSVWGNDFTLHAAATPALGRLTRQALGAAAALHADCQRDLRLGADWGFPAGRPQIVLPGAGGVQTELFQPRPEAVDPWLVVMPRGRRAYVSLEAFFAAVPLVRARCPQAHFALPALADDPQAAAWRQASGHAAAIELLPTLERPAMAALFQRAAVTVSPTTHDGTPNTLLEALACGSFPVAGDLESLREWITPGVNGLLCDPTDPAALAAAIVAGLDTPALRAAARSHNQALIAARAAYAAVMPQAADFYREIV